jgi:hypothetical protein
MTIARKLWLGFGKKFGRVRPALEAEAARDS